MEIADPEEKYEAMTRAAKEADRLGYDSIWLFDHFHTVPTPELETTFECYTSLAGLARDTQYVKLGQMATCNGYRNPALLAKMGSTIDVMSQGRFLLGFGAGWYEHEFRAYGYGYPDTRERMARFREATEIIYRMWTEDYPTFSGNYYTIDKPINEPKGVQKPHPPLWLAGSGEKVTLKLVAQWGMVATSKARIRSFYAISWMSCASTVLPSSATLTNFHVQSAWTSTWWTVKRLQKPKPQKHVRAEILRTMQNASMCSRTSNLSPTWKGS